MSSELKEIENAVEEAAEAKEEAPAAEEKAIVGSRDYEIRYTDEELARKKKIREVWDKITTGLLIFLMASPILILLYIFIWFMTK